MKKIAVIALLLTSYQISAESCLMKTIPIPGLGDVTYQSLALTTLGITMTCIKNCNKDTKDLPAEIIKTLALEQIFSRMKNLGKVELLGYSISNATPQNKRFRAVLLAALKETLKTCGVNPAVDITNSTVQALITKS